MQASISLAVITSQKDKEMALKAIEKVRPFVDEIVLDENNGIDDFAKARNDNFSKCTGDWILWMDADDTFNGLEKLREIVKIADENGVEAIDLLYKYGFDEAGNCIDEHWKTQLIKNSKKLEWRGAIHENLIAKAPIKRARYSEIIRIHHTDNERGANSSERNRIILEKEHKNNPEEPRTMFYLGRAYIMQNKYDEAIKILNKYLDYSGWDDERYEACLLIGQCYYANGQIDSALEWYTRATVEKEEYPDAYIYKGMAYLQKEQFKKAIVNFESAGIRELPPANTFFNPMLYRRDFPIAMAYGYLNLGLFDKALMTVEKAVKNYPKDRKALDMFEMIKSIHEKRGIVNIYEKLLTYLKDKNKAKYLLNSVPNDLMDDPLILRLRSEFLGNRKWNDNEIAVFCGSTVEDWTPDSVNGSGIGGSETAVVELTKRLAKYGWKITVYNQCSLSPEGKEFDGVLYKNYWEFNPKDEFNILWVWRLPEVYKNNIKAKFKILDLHDTMIEGEVNKELSENINKIFVKSSYHRSLYPDVADDKFAIIGNGIDIKRFKLQEKDPLRFIYSSSPIRGLDIVLENIWPKIIEKHPEATLHTYYGWKTFFEMEKHNPAMMKWMKKTQALMQQKGVINHGRVGQKELAEDMAKSSYWLYPTDFPEIHCITACEMQAAGVIPITSGFAALRETAKRGIILTGDVRSKEYQEQYVNAILETLNKDNSNLIKNLISDASEFDWDLVAREWNNICQKRK